MWYWLAKFEGVLFIPFTPIFLASWRMRGIPLSFRCKKCRSWLLRDPRTFRFGICEKCYNEMIWSDITKFQKELYEEQGALSPAITPEEPYFGRVVKKVGYGKVLDVGCGSGYLLSKLKSEFLCGMDLSAGAVKEAGNRVKQGHFCVADARSIAFKSNVFDYVVCTEVLEHIEGNDTVRECYRVLKRGGVMLVTVPNGKGPYGRFFVSHIKFFTYQSIADLLKETGFEIISGQKFGLYIPFLTTTIGMLSNVLHKNLTKFNLLDRLNTPELLAHSFFIECRKPEKEA